MRKLTAAGVAALFIAAAGAAHGQEPEAPFAAGKPLGAVNQAGQAVPMSKNVKVFGSFRFAESCTYDAARDLILAVNAGVAQAIQPNDGYISRVRPDGSVETSKWIGVNRNGLTLNQPLGSAIHAGALYVADIDFVRMFDLESGAPKGAVQVPGATGLNGLAVAGDGTIYASNTSGAQRIYKVTPAGQASVFVEGPPLLQPNGLAIDPAGNIVAVNIGNNEVLTFDRAGKLIRTEHAAEAGNDGLVILPDGVKYVSSVRYGSISKIAPGQKAEVIASGVPNAASICYDSRQRQIVIPMNDNNALGFLPIR